MRWFGALFAVSLSTACSGDADVDEDGDGFYASEDCDDSDPAVNPSVIEVCDGYDNNCDGQVDEVGAVGGASFFYDEV